QHRRPAVRTFAVAVFDRNQFLRPVGAHPDHHQRTEAILLEADAKVDAIDPDVHVVDIVQIALAPHVIVRFPGRRQPRDGRRRQAASLRAQQDRQRRLEVARRQSAQVENRQDLGHLRRLAHVAGENLAGETVPLAVGGDTPIIDARRAHRQGATAGDQLPYRRLAVPHDLRPPLRIARLAVPPDVLVDLGLERLVQHLQRPALQQLVQRGPQFLVLFRRLLDYSQHGWRLLRPAANRVRVFGIHTKDTPPFVIQPIHNIRLYLRCRSTFQQLPSSWTARSLGYSLSCPANVLTLS